MTRLIHPANLMTVAVVSLLGIGCGDGGDWKPGDYISDDEAGGAGPGGSGPGVGGSGPGVGGSGPGVGGSGPGVGGSGPGVGGSGTGGSGTGGSGTGGSGTGGSGTGGSGTGGSGTGGSGVGGVGGTGNFGGTSGIDPNTGKLRPPEPGKGFQIETKDFSIPPGGEMFNCFYAEVPSDTEIAVSAWEGYMADGSHHWILYRDDAGTTPSGTLVNRGCTSGFGGTDWLYTTGAPGHTEHMPVGVAMPLKARQRIKFDMHYINTTSQAKPGKAMLNIHLAQGQYERASALVSFNVGINVPPNGTQTVTGTCTPGAGAKFFAMTTHTHKRGTLATIKRQNGEEIVHSTDWEFPAAEHWLEPPYFTFAPGESFTYSCSYKNEGATAVRVGTSAERDEMCMAITYFFPASAAGTCR
jgi:hypothetical protein